MGEITTENIFICIKTLYVTFTSHTFTLKSTIIFQHSGSCCRLTSVQHCPLVCFAGTEGELCQLHNSYKYTAFTFRATKLHSTNINSLLINSYQQWFYELLPQVWRLFDTCASVQMFLKHNKTTKVWLPGQLNETKIINKA